MPTRVRLKVCCIASVDEARLAIASGADALGLVARMPTGPGPIADDDIRAIATVVPPPIATFLLTSETDPAAIVAHARSTRVSTVQIVDDEVGPVVYGTLRDALPALRIVQVIHVRDDASIDRALAAARRVDALLLDSGNPVARELGGTGRAHDWSISRRIVERSPVPVFLAGGLNATNIADAVRAVRPFGVDLCSGVRTGGALDAVKLAAFTAALCAAPSHAE
jgi:phosphoribosylanthranilate isomerase